MFAFEWMGYHKMISSHQIHIQFFDHSNRQIWFVYAYIPHPSSASPTQMNLCASIWCVLLIITFMESQSVNQINTMCSISFGGVCNTVHNTIQWHENSIQMRMWMFSSAFCSIQYIFMCFIWIWSVCSGCNACIQRCACGGVVYSPGKLMALN